MPLDLTVNEEELQEQIVDRAVKKLVGELYEDDYSADFDTKLERIVRQKYDKMIEEELRDKVRDTVAEAIDGTYQPTDSYGTPKGSERKTLREAIADLARDQLKLSGNRAGYRDKTALDEYLAREVQAAVKEDLGAEFAEARKKLAEGLNSAITKALTDALDKKNLRF